MTKDSQLAAKQLLAECFSEDEAAFLQGIPEFTRAAANAGDLHAALDVLTLGARLIEKHRPTFRRARTRGLLLGSGYSERARM